MIANHYFKTYVKDFTEEVGYLSNMKDNPLQNHIDWQSWADEIKADYQEYQNPFDENIKIMGRNY